MRILALASIGLSLSSASAAASTKPFSWDTCVKQTELNNPDLKSAEASVNSARALIGGARSGFLPQITTRAEATRAQIDPNLPNNEFALSVTASQSLFSGFQDLAKLHQAEHSLRAAEAGRQLARAKASFDLKTGYENLAYANYFSVLTRNIIKRREENLKLVELRYDSGRENKGSVLLSRANLKLAQYEELEAKNARETAIAQLAKAMGLTDFTELQSHGIEGVIPNTEPPQEPDFILLATQTPERLQSFEQTASAEEAVHASEAGFYPALSATATQGRLGDGFFPQNGRWSAGVHLTFPLFSGGKDYYSRESAVSIWRASGYSLKSVESQGLLRLRQTFAAFMESVQKLKVDEAFRDAATARAEIARNKYNNGLLTFEDWDIIENDLILRQKTYLQSKRDRVIAEAAWEQAQGKGVLQ